MTELLPKRSYSGINIEIEESIEHLLNVWPDTVVIHCVGINRWGPLTPSISKTSILPDNLTSNDRTIYFEGLIAQIACNLWKTYDLERIPHVQIFDLEFP